MIKVICLNYRHNLQILKAKHSERFKNVYMCHMRTNIYTYLYNVHMCICTTFKLYYLHVTIQSFTTESFLRYHSPSLGHITYQVLGFDVDRLSTSNSPVLNKTVCIILYKLYMYYIITPNHYEHINQLMGYSLLPWLPGAILPTFRVCNVRYWFANMTDGSPCHHTRLFLQMLEGLSL